MVIHRYKTLKPRGLVASLAVTLTGALAAALVSVLMAYTPALAQSTAADTRHPRVIEVKPAEDAKGVSPTRRVVAFFSEDMRPGSAMRAIKLYKKGSDTLEDSTMGYNAAQRKVTRWYCGTDDAKEGSADPPTQCSGSVLGLKIIFPDCVAEASPGVQQIDSPDHRSHMARSVAQGDGTRRCPSTHPIPVPTLTVNANFPMPTTSGTVTLSSDDPGDPPGSTMHSDFWNTWVQNAPLNLNPPDGRSFGGLDALVKHCINEVPPTSPRPTECRAPTATA